MIVIIDIIDTIEIIDILIGVRDGERIIWEEGVGFCEIFCNFAE